MFKERKAAEGLHLFDRARGINILLDELSYPEEEWSAAPRYVSIALTNACELSCPHCYAPKHGAVLRFERVAAWAADLDEAGCLGVGFGGGEPTLYPRFAKLCATIAGRTGLSVSMTTHGQRFTPELSAALRGSVNFIRLSMDGIGTTFKRMRGMPFAAFQEKLPLVRATAPFGINYVINRETIIDLPAAAEFAFASGARELLLLPEVDQTGRVRADAVTMAVLSDWVEQNHRRFRLAVSVNAASVVSAPQLDIGCPAGPLWEFMHVDASGNLKGCAFGGGGVPIGDGQIMDAVSALRRGAALALA